MNRLKEAREAKGMTQTELARRSGVCRPTIIQIEKGEETEIKVSTIIRISNALDEKPRDIFLQ